MPDTWKNSQQGTETQQRFLVLQAAAREYSRLSWYPPARHPSVGDESGETEGSIGRLNKLYNFDLFTSYRIGFKFRRSTIATTRWIHLGVFDARTKTYRSAWQSLLIPVKRRDHGTHPYVNHCMCFPTKKWFYALPCWYKIQETAYCVAGGNQDHHPDQQWPFKE